MSSNNSSSGSNRSGDFPITITARDVGIDQSINKLTRFADVIKTLDSQIKASLNSMSAYQNIFNSFGRNFTTLNQGFNQGAQGAQKFGQAMQQNVNVLRQGQTTLNQFMNTQRQTVSTTQQAASAEATLTANTLRMNQAFSQTSATLGRAQGQIMNLNRNAQQTANTMRNATAQTRMYDAAIFENNNALNSNNAATESHTKSTQSNTDAIINNMRHISALGMGFMMLSNTMSDSSLVQENIKMQQDKLAEAHQRTAQALQEHGKASHQYQQAAQAEAKIARGLAFEQREATAQQHNMMFMQAMIASEILSTAVPALLKYKETIAQVSGAWTKLKSVMTATNITNAFSGLSNVLSAIPGKLRNTTVAAGAVGGAMANAESYTMKATKQMGALSTVQPVVAGGFRSMMVAAAPFIAIIVAVGIALAAISTDFMGVRTSLEQFGYSIGEAVPILYPFLEGLQGIGAQLGLTGESAEEAKQHFDNASTGFEHMGELWDQTVSSMQNSSNRMVKAMGDTAAVLGRDIAQAAQKMDTQLKATADTWNQFVDALGRGDYKTATDLIISSFEALPGIIFESLKSLGQIVGNAFIGLGNTVGPAIIGIGTELGTRLYDGIIAGITPILQWIQSSIITPIQNFFNGIASGLSNIADAILNALGLTGLPQAALTLASAIGKGIMKIVDYASDISKSLWDKLQLNGLVEKATDLAKDIWASITGFFNSASAQSADNIDQGTSPMLTDDQVAEIDKANKAKAQAIQDRLKKGEKIPGYNTATQITPSTTTTTTNPNPPGLVSPNNVMSPNNQDYSKFQQAFAPVDSKPTVKSPEPTTKTTAPPPKSTSPYALDNSTSNFIGGGVTATGSGSGKGTHEFIKSLQQTAKPIDDQATKLKKLAEADDEATKAGAALLLNQTGMAAQLPNNTAQLENISKAVGGVTIENDKLKTSLDNNALALQNNALQGELQRKGQLEQQKAFQDMQMQIETNKGSLQEYAKQVEEGTILGYAFTLGQQEQRKALLDSKVEVANTTGMLQEYALQLESGEAQSVAFAQGQLEIVKQFDDTIVETENLNGQFKLLEVALGSAEAAQIEFNNGVAKGRVETAQQIIAMDALSGAYVGTNEVLVDQAKTMGMNADATRLSNDALENWIAVAKKVPEAVQAMIDSFTEFADSAIDSVAEALKEGGDAIDEAFDKIEESLGDNLTGDEKLVIEVQADTQNAVENVKSSFSLAFQWVMNQDIIIGQGGVDMSQLQSAVTERLGETLDKVEEQFNDSGGVIKTGWSNIMSELQNLNKPENIMNKDAWITAANDIAVNFSTMGKSAGEAMTFLTGLGIPAETAATALSNAGYSASELGKAVAATDPELQKMITSIERLNTIDSTATQIFTVNIPGYVVTMAAAIVAGFLAAEVGAIQELNTIDTTATQIFVTNIPSYPVNVANAVDEQFGKAADDGISLMEALDSSVSQSFDNMSGYPQVVSQAVDQEFGKAADDGKNLIQALESAVKSSCDAMASAFEKVASAVDKIGSSADNAKSSVNSLKSAVESLPNIDRKITYHIETVGTKPKGAQFGTNMLVDKPQMLLVGEGFGKERIKVSPGTMPFAEDFRNEMNQKFEIQRTAQTPQAQQQQGNPNVYSSNYTNNTPTNQQNNPDLGGSGGGTGMMISNNASLVQMNNSNGKRMIVDGKTGTVIMLDSSASTSNNSNTNTNTGSGSGNGGGNGNNVNEGTGNHYTDANGNNYNYDNDSNSQNNVYAPGYGQNTPPPPPSISNTPPPPPPTSSQGGNGINQSQTNNQSGSGGNYYYQSQTNNGQTRVNTNMGSMPSVSPGLINQSSASSGNIPTSGSSSSDSRSRLLSRGDPFGFQTRIVHETPVEVNIDLEGVRIARKILKILTEEMGFGSGYYG